MNKSLINVPPGIRYISEWNGFSFSNFQGPCIIDKVIPGCGMTEYAITCPENVIVCSPRKILLENKHSQHPNTTYLVVSESSQTLDVDRKFLSETTNRKVPGKFSISKQLEQFNDPASILNKAYQDDQDNLKSAVDHIRPELSKYLSYCNQNSLPCKILVTYDSFKVIKKILEELFILSGFTVFVDEFQSILHDSRFKPGVEIEFLKQLSGLNKVYFVSATPMMEKYLDSLDEFKNLNYYRLDWDTLQPGRLTRPDLDVFEVSKVSDVIDKVIGQYKAGRFQSVILDDGTEVYSKEAVIYVNSVDMILSAIKRNKLGPGEVNILCASTPKNLARVRKLGPGFDIGVVPLRGEPRKMFTFCTRTVYLGADFYSDNARSFIFSNANLDYLSVDISQDLPQILGRQRLLENPWKNSAEFYYVPFLSAKLDGAILTEYQNKKMGNTKYMLSQFNDNPGVREYLLNQIKGNQFRGYRDDYISIEVIRDPATGELSEVPVCNYLVYTSEQRAFDIQQVDYRDRFSVAATIVLSSRKYAALDTEYLELFKLVEDTSNLTNKFKILTAAPEVHRSRYVRSLKDSDFVKKAFMYLGVDKIKALGCHPTDIKNKLIAEEKLDRSKIDLEFLNTFKPGTIWLTSDIKRAITEIYQRLDYNAAAKGRTDLAKYFEISRVLVTVVDPETGKKKRSEGFKIIRPLL